MNLMVICLTVLVACAVARPEPEPPVIGKVHHTSSIHSSPHHGVISHDIVSHGGFPHDGFSHGGISKGGISHGVISHGGISHDDISHGGFSHGGILHGGNIHGGISHGGISHGVVTHKSAPHHVTVHHDHGINNIHHDGGFSTHGIQDGGYVSHEPHHVISTTKVHHDIHDDYKTDPKYSFGYGVRNDYTGTNFGHSEKRDGYKTEGEYYVNLPDGRLQKVSYYVDEWGYHPTVTYVGKAHFPEHIKKADYH